MAGNKSVDIKFGVLGGTSISGESSGKFILDQLTSIAGKISSGNKLKVKVSLDTSETEKILTQQMREIVKSLSLGGNKEGMAFFKLLNKDIDQYVGKMKKAGDSIDALKAKLNKNQTVGLATALTKNTYGTEGLEYYKKSLDEINQSINSNDAAGATKKFSEMFSKLNEFRAKKIISDANQKDVDKFNSKIDELNKSMAELNDLNKKGSFGSGGKKYFEDNYNDASNAISVAETIEDAQKAYDVFYKGLSNTKIDLNSAMGFNAVNIKVDEFRRKFGDILSATNSEKIDNFSKELNNGFFTSAKDAKNAWFELERQIIETGGLTESVGQKISRIFKEKFGYGVIATAAMMARQVIKQVYTNVVELDSAVVDLQIASGKTRDQVKEMMSDYAKLGQKLGVSTTDIAASADTWLRQGYTTVEETQKLITASQELAVLGQLNSADAATYLTSMMKGYQLSVEDAEDIVSKLVKVDMEAATSAGDLAEAIKETANSARLSGVSLDELIGYITTVAEVTQMEAGRVGTAYKTMFARMAAIKDNMLEDPETGESLGTVESTLSGLGIKLRESNSEFRDFSEVLDEVAANWDSYSSVQQRAIAKAFGNTRNQEVVLTLFENYDQALKYTETSLNSAGTAQEKYKSYADSVKASQEALTAAFQDFSQTLVNSDGVKIIFDMATGFTNLVTEGAKLKVLLPTLLSLGLGAKGKTFGSVFNGFSQRLQLPRREILTMYNSYMSDKNLAGSVGTIAEEFLATGQITDRLTGKIYKLKASELELIKANKGAAISQNDLKKSTEGTVGAFESLKGGIKAAAINLAISASVWALSKGFEYLATNVFVTQKAFDAFENTVSEYTSKTSEVESLNDEIAEAAKRIAELQDKAKNGTITLVEQAELEKLKEQNNLLKQQLVTTKNLAAEKSKESQKQFQKLMGNYNAGGGLNDLSWADLIFTDSPNPRTNAQVIEDYIKEGNVDKATEKLSKFREALVALYDAGYNYGGNASIDKYIDQLHDLDLAISVQEKDFNKYLELLSSDPRYSAGYEKLVAMANGGKKLSDAMATNDDDIITFVDAIEKSGLVSGTTKDVLKRLENQILGVGRAYADMGAKAEAANSSTLASTLEVLGDIEDRYDSVAKVFKEFSDDGTISTKSLSSIYESFKDTVPEIEEYIRAISMASNTTELENSLESLYEDYLNSNTVIELLIGGQKDLVISRLEDLGVVNAQEVAEERLAIVALKNLEISGASTDALLKEAEAAGLTGEQIVALAIQKKLLNENGLLDMTNAEAKSLLNLAKAAGFAGEKIKLLADLEYYEAQISMAKSVYESGTKNATNYREYRDAVKYYKEKIRDVGEQIKTEFEPIYTDIDSGWESRISSPQIKIDTASPSTYRGATSSSSKSSSQADEYKKSFDDWYDRLKYLYDTDQISQETYLKRLNSKYKEYYKDRTKYDEEYRKYNEEVYKGYKELFEKSLDDQIDAFEKKKELLEEQANAVDDEKEKELDALNEIYEARKQALENEKEDNDYKKEQAEKRESVLKLTSKIAELEKDTSSSARAKVAQLREQLIEAQDTLNEFEANRAYEQQLSRLEEEQAAKEDEINKKFEADREKLQNSVSVIEEKIKAIEAQKSGLSDDDKLAWALVVAFAKQQGITITSAYASGTSSAYGGWARTQEAGSELVAKKLSDGSFATFLPKGSKVFNAKATDFLYSLANSPIGTLKSVFKNASSSVHSNGNTSSVVVGDIVINGNADVKTVSALKQARSEIAYEILTEFKKLQRQ